MEASVKLSPETQLTLADIVEVTDEAALRPRFSISSIPTRRTPQSK